MAKAKPSAAEWTALTFKRLPVLIAERSVFAAWTGMKPLGKRLVLHYWGHPAVSTLPKHLQPNGRVGHQYLECEGEAEAAARYREICAALRATYPTVVLTGPEPDDPKAIAQLRKKQAYFAPPKQNGMTLAVEPASATVRAEHAAMGDAEELALAQTFTTPAGGSAVVTQLDGRCQVHARDGEVVFVCCPKSGEAKVLAAALAGTAVPERDHGSLAVRSRELVIASARIAGDALAGELEKAAAAIVRCRAGTYAIRAGYEYPVSVLRLVAG